MRRSLLNGLSAALALVILTPPTAGHAAALAGTGTGTVSPTAAAVAPPLSWHACPSASAGVTLDPRQQCATLRVPLDYRRPGGRQIDVEISRIASATPTLRRGILLLNPGGPGGSGLNLPSALAALLPAQVTERYDLIGFDPRGVGFSTPVTCGMTLETPPDLQLPFPAPDGSIARNVAFARQTAAGCAAGSGDLLPYITTANTARDMDRIRGALAEPTLSYLGYSYGTYLGAVYTSLFPQRSDRVVLDSAVNPRLVWYDQWRLFSLGFALRFPDFTGWAAARDATYHLGSTPGAVTKTYYATAARLDRDPVVLPGVVFNGNVYRLFTFSELYADADFPTLATIWREFAAPVPATAVTATGMAALRTALARVAPAAAAEVPADNLRAAQYAVVCDDAAWSSDIGVYARNVAVDRRVHPGTAGFPANLWPCVFWPNRPVEPPVQVTGNGPRNVLVLQNLRDPATPWVSGFGLRTALGRRAAMVSVDQGGHGVYPLTNAPCAADIATAFLASGTLPDRDRLCPGQAPGQANAQPLLARIVPTG